MRLVFMGTPDFAVPCLRRLAEDGHEVLAVFTQPDKPQGRKFIITPPPVKVAAQDRNGKEFTIKGEELLARAFCHEIDHLSGRIFKDIAEEMVEIKEEEEE